MDPVRRSATTDLLLARTMQGVGDHDPTTIQQDTGKPLHFDAWDSAAVRRGANKDTPFLDGVKEEGLSRLREKAIEHVTEFLEVGALGPILNAMIGLGEGYSNGVEKPHQEGDKQRALLASDAGVVALAQSLSFPHSFQASVALAHPGALNVAASMTVALKGDSSALAELQFRADQGFVDAAGYAKMAAVEMAPLLALGLTKEAAEVENKYMAPVMSQAHDDAAYGLGVQHAVFSAIRAQGGSAADRAFFDAAFGRANANVSSVARPIVISG